MLSRRSIAWALAALLVPALAPAQEPKERRKEQEKGDRPAARAGQFVGTYTIVSGEEDGRPVPPERLRDNSARITEDRFVVVDADKKERYAASYRLMADRPTEGGGYKIAMRTVAAPGEQEGTEAIGLIKKEGDKVTLIYTVPGGEPPTEFKTKPGSKQNLFVLQHVEPRPAP